MHRRHALREGRDPAELPDAQTRPTVRPPAQGRSSGMQLRARAGDQDPRPTAAADSTLPESARHAQEEALLQALLAGDASSALLLASTLTYLDPLDPVVRRIKARCAERLGKKPKGELALRDAVPRMHLPWTALMDRTLSRNAAYVLACVDGASTVEVLIEVTALRPLVAYEVLEELVLAGIVALS